LTGLELATGKNTGTKQDGSVWKRFKLKFNHCVGDMVKTASFNVFSPLTYQQQLCAIQPESMMMGSTYRVLFKESAVIDQQTQQPRMSDNGLPMMSKSAINILASSGEQQGYEQVQQTPQQQIQNNQIPTMQPQSPVQGQGIRDQGLGIQPQNVMGEHQLGAGQQVPPPSQQQLNQQPVPATGNQLPPQAVPNPISPTPNPQWSDEQFCQQYRDTDQVPISEKTLVHFIGTYVNSRKDDQGLVQLSNGLKTLYDNKVMPKG